MSMDELSEQELVGLGQETSIPFGELGGLEHRLGYTFRDRTLLERALTHPSYANERDHTRSNQRLEFLGDSVLGVVVASELYLREELEDEGKLTRQLSTLVCEDALAIKARELGLGDFLRLGKGEDSQGGRERPSILCDTYEAVLAAIYLDGGFEAARRVVRALHVEELAGGVRTQPREPNYKGQLQRLVQARHNVQPSYHVIGERGPEHVKQFVVEVRVHDEGLAQGQGRSKKQAEQAAAAAALQALDASGKGV
jgi:ribonuclease III